MIVAALVFGVRFAGDPLMWLGWILGIFFLGLGMSCFFLAVTASSTDWQTPGVISNFITMPLMFASGALLPLANFPAWMQATQAGETSPCTDFKFTYGGASTGSELGYDQTAGATNQNLVVVRKGQCSDPSIAPASDACHATFGACAAKYNCWEHGNGAFTANTLALTTTTFNVATGEILDADMELNGWNGDAGTPQDGSAGWYFTCGGTASSTCSTPPYGQSACNWIDLGNTVTHEVGHMLGLDHVCVSSYPAPYNACPSPTPVMAPTAAFGETFKRALSSDDTSAICTMYPAGAATKTCVSSGTDGGSGTSPAKSGGCNVGGSGLAALAGTLFLLALRGWRRSRHKRTVVN